MELDKVEVERLISLLRSFDNAIGEIQSENCLEDLMGFLTDIIKDKTGMFV